MWFLPGLGAHRLEQWAPQFSSPFSLWWWYSVSESERYDSATSHAFSPFIALAYMLVPALALVALDHGTDAPRWIVLAVTTVFYLAAVYLGRDHLAEVMPL